jgi:hypothetical protein
MFDKMNYKFKDGNYIQYLVGKIEFYSTKMEKAKRAEVGEIRTHGKKRMKKIAEGKWVEIKEGISKQKQDKKTTKEKDKKQNKLSSENKNIIKNAAKKIVSIIADAISGRGVVGQVGEATEEIGEGVSSKVKSKNKDMPIEKNKYGDEPSKKKSDKEKPSTKDKKTREPEQKEDKDKKDIDKKELEKIKTIIKKPREKLTRKEKDFIKKWEESKTKISKS